VWIVTILGGGRTIAFGSFLGVPSLGMHAGLSAVLAVSGVLVLILIIALSHPFRGDFRVSTQPFDQVLARIETAPSQPAPGLARGAASDPSGPIRSPPCSPPRVALPRSPSSLSLSQSVARGPPACRPCGTLYVGTTSDLARRV
jgi:hypothetical protein